MHYFDNGPLIQSLEVVRVYNTPNPTKSNSVYWIVGIVFCVAAGSIYYWNKHKNKMK